MQRMTTPSSSRLAGAPQTGQSVGKDVRLLRAGALAGDDGDDLGDHVARAAHEDVIALAHVLALQLVLVVQRGAADHHATHLHRLQEGHRASARRCGPR